MMTKREILRLTLALILLINFSNADYDEYTWSTLTTEQQDKILNSDFNFQGRLIKISELTNDTNIFNHLNSNDIRELLLSDTIVTIDKNDYEKNKFYIERHFTDGTKIISQNEIANGEYFDAFILSDEAGSGKSTTVRDLMDNFKVNFRNKWITCVRFKEHIDAFNGTVTSESLVNYLGRKIFKLNDFDFLIFEKLFNDNNTIIFWEDFDEISPIHDTFALNLLAEIKNTTKNIQFVTTRSLYTEKLEAILDIKAHKFIPFTSNDREDFLIAYLERNKFTVREIVKSQSYFDNFLRKIDGSNKAHEIHNPLMLKIILNSIKEKFNKKIDDMTVNLFSFYEDFMKGKNYEKFKSEHQALAMREIFGDSGIRDIQTNETHDISSFDIVKNIDIVELSKIGIINAHDNGKKFNFDHRTYSEFFIAQYLIDGLKNGDLNDSEAKLRIKLLFFILSDENFKVIRQFIEDYFVIEPDMLKANEKMTEIIASEFKYVFNHFFLTNESLAFVDSTSNFFKNNQNILNALWRLDDNETFFIWYFKECSDDDSFGEIHKMAMKYFPNKNDQEKLFYGDDQTSNIIFNLWLQKDEEKYSWKKFYTRKFSNDNRITYFDNLNFDEISSREEDRKELLLRNSFRILHLCFIDELIGWGSIEWMVEYNNIEKSKFISSIDWKSGNTTLHELARIGKIDSVKNFVDTIKAYMNATQIKELLSMRNRVNHETAFMIAALNQDEAFLNTLSDLIEDRFIFDSIVDILNPNYDASILISSMKNKNEKVFPLIRNLYDFYFSLNETRKQLLKNQRGSLSFLLDKDSRFNDKNYRLLAEYLERIFNDNFHDLRFLFANENEDFKEIYQKIINSDENLKLSSLIDILTKALTDEEMNEVSSLDRNIIKNEKYSSHEFSSMVNSILEIFSIKCNYRSGYSLDYSDQRTQLDSQLENLFLNKDDLINKLDINSIEAISMYYRKDEVNLRKFWRIDETQTLFYDFIFNKRVDDVDYLVTIARKFFNSTDMDKLYYDKMGRILHDGYSRNFLSYSYLEKIIWKLCTIRYKINDENFNTAKIFNNISHHLSVESQKYLLTIDVEEIFLSDLYNIDSNEYEMFWERIGKVISNEELNEIFTKKFSQSLLRQKLESMESIDHFRIFVNHLSQILSNDQFFNLMNAKNYNNEILLMTLLTKYDHFIALWNASNTLLNSSQQKVILTIKSSGLNTLQQSFYKPLLKTYTFEYIKNVYLKLFTTKEIQDMIMSEDSVNLEQYIESWNFPSVAQFLFKTFENDKDMFLEYLGRRSDGTYQTVFERGSYNENREDNLDILIKYARENYDSDEIESIGIKTY